MNFKKHFVMAALMVCGALSFTSGGALNAQDTPSQDSDSTQWSSWSKPKVGGQEQGFSFRSACTRGDNGNAAWLVELQNDQSHSFSISGEKHTSLGTVEAGALLDLTIAAPNCKKQPQLTVVEMLDSDDNTGLWYIYTYKDGKAKGKLHDSSDPGWLGIAAAVLEQVAAQQQLQ
jgi:hypothetical protein